MPINAHPEFLAAEKEYIAAQTLEEKIEKLKKMISMAPSHKGGENLRKQLTTRRKKLETQLIKSKKTGKGKQKGIKKEDMQAVIIGLNNSGKSSLLKILTNAKPIISEIQFTTITPLVGMMHYAGTQIQLIEIPSVESDYYNKGIVHTADTLLMIINNLEDINKIESHLHTKAKRIIVFNLKNSINKRKLEATLKSKKYNFCIIDIKTKEGIEDLKEKIFQSFDNIRVYTKEPGKSKSNRPIVLKPESTVKDVAEKILHGFSKQVSEIKIWGPSSKFAGQKVGLKHKLKDLDVIEFKTR